MLLPNEIEVGRVVCETGNGTAAIVHRHLAIARLTKTQIVLSNGGRFTRDGHNRSIPYHPHGETMLCGACQRPEDSAARRLTPCSTRP